MRLQSKLNAAFSLREYALIFENLGVDYLFVDEAHYYKNKFLFTKMNNVAGISTAASQRASDLELKCEYINELQGGDKGVVFATGTPISNSMTEMYTISMTVAISNSSGTRLASGSKKATASGLTEGTYKVSISASGGGTINSRAGWGASFSGSFEFKIDGSAPTISGASTSKTGKYVNSAFTVTASDSASGVKALYMKAPNNSTFYSVGTSTTVNKGSANGLYTYYAEDNAGNRSGYYYVNFDDTPPTITCVGASFGSNTNAGFTVKAEDNSGSVTLYRKVNDGGWTASGKSYTVSNMADDATYYFYATDGNYGNRTSEVSNKIVVFANE